MRKHFMKKVKENRLIIVTIIFFLYEEIVFSILANGNLQNLDLKILFTVVIAMVISILTNVFSQKINKVLYSIFIIIIPIIYITYYIYYKTFGAVISSYSLLKGTEVLQFSTALFNIMISHWYAILLFVLPVFIYILGVKKIEIERINLKKLRNICSNTNNSVYTIYFYNFDRFKRRYLFC